MNTITILSIVGIAAGMFLLGMSFSPDKAIATICPIDQVEEQLDAANKAYQQQNYIEVKNNLDSIQELVDSVKDEE